MKKVFFLFMMVLFGTALSAQNMIPVNYKDLPKDAQKYISKNFDGYTVDKAMEGQQKGKTQHYDVQISKGTEKLELTFDKDGAFVKKVPVHAHEGATTAPGAAPAHHPATAPTHSTTPTHVPAATPEHKTETPDTTKK